MNTLGHCVRSQLTISTSFYRLRLPIFSFLLLRPAREHGRLPLLAFLGFLEFLPMVWMMMDSKLLWLFEKGGYWLSNTIGRVKLFLWLRPRSSLLQFALFTITRKFDVIVGQGSSIPTIEEMCEKGTAVGVLWFKDGNIPLRDRVRNEALIRRFMIIKTVTSTRLYLYDL